MNNDQTSSSKGIANSQVTKLAELISYQTGAIISREIVKGHTGNITIFSFDEGQGLSEHKTPFDALVQVLEGEVEISIDGKLHRVESGEIILMPAQKLHALRALKRFKMILTMLRT
ncbi:MAG: cupin domain-containing protein [Bacteroidota bacterium]